MHLHPGMAPSAAPESKEPVPASSGKRPPASPARGTGEPLIPPSPGQTPVKSPDLKKQKGYEGQEDASISWVDAYNEKLAAESKSPVAPCYDMDEDHLDRQHPVPHNLHSVFEGVAGECPAADGGLPSTTVSCLSSSMSELGFMTLYNIIYIYM